MATDFVMPQLPDQQQANMFQTSQHMSYGSQHYSQISPLSTSNNTSPTSPSKSYHSRQLRPLYMPAVLRPTEFPSKVPSKRSAEDPNSAASIKSNNSFISLGGLTALSRLSRRSVGECSKINTSDWNLELFPQVTDLPTRKHWKPDPESTVCDEPTCKRYFSYFTRRHHCRKCGNIFCDFHSSYEVPLDQDANFNPRAATSRSCSHCFEEFRAWSSRTNSQASSTSSSDTANGSGTAPTTPIMSSPTAVKGALAVPKTQDAAMSVPRDWNWSTF